MLSFVRKRPVPVVPPSGSTFCMVGDSIMDRYLTQPWPGGQSADTICATFGWTRVAIGTAGAIVTAGGSGYTAGYNFNTSGGGATTNANGTTVVYNGAIVGIVWIIMGAGLTSAPTVPNGGGGTGATFNVQVSGGQVVLPVAQNSNSTDGTRAAMGGTTLQAGGSAGFDLQSNLVARCTAYNAHVTAIFLGANDYYQLDPSGSTGLTVGKYKAAYQTAITAIQAMSNYRMCILYGMHQMPAAPTGGVPTGFTDRFDIIRAMNQAIMELATDNHCVYVPLMGLPATALSTDGIHPTQTDGHAWIVGRSVDAHTGRR